VLIVEGSIVLDGETHSEYATCMGQRDHVNIPQAKGMWVQPELG
jgi:hypothetical protein